MVKAVERSAHDSIVNVEEFLKNDTEEQQDTKPKAISPETK